MHFRYKLSDDIKFKTQQTYYFLKFTSSKFGLYKDLLIYCWSLSIAEFFVKRRKPANQEMADHCPYLTSLNQEKQSLENGNVADKTAAEKKLIQLLEGIDLRFAVIGILNSFYVYLKVRRFL